MALALFAEDLAKVIREQSGISGTLAKGRHINDHDIEAVEEVLTKTSGFCEFRKIAIGGGYDPDVDLHRSVSAHAHQFAFL